MERFEKLVENIYRLQVPFGSVWTGVVLVLGHENALIDTGACADDVDECIVPALGELGLKLEDISWVIPTHIHGDHVGGCARLHELQPEIRFACYAASEARMRDPLTHSKAIRARFPGQSAPAPKALDGVTPDCLLKNGDTLCELRLIHTPGHDTDACSLLHEPTGTLITGDSLQLNGTMSQGCALLMDVPGYASTLEKLSAMPEIKNIVCGHDYLPLGSVAIGKEQTGQYLRACAACYEHDKGFVHGMQAAGITDELTIARALIAEIGGTEPKYLFLPLHTVTGFMQRD